MTDREGVDADMMPCAMPDCESDASEDWTVLCEVCARQLAYRYIGVTHAEELFTRYREIPDEPPERIAQRAEAVRRQAEASQVYYLRMPGGHIKIGYSKNITQRCANLRIHTSAVLATEPGGNLLEKQRHAEFAHIRIGRWEEFEPDDELMAHIAAIREKHGTPRITGYVYV